MPSITNGRVSTNGTGSISFVYNQTTTSAVSSNPSTAISVTGNTEGNGVPLFLNQNSNVGNVILNFSSLGAGTNITFDTTTIPGEIIINSTGGGGGGGGVSSVAATGTAGQISITGSPVTTSGTFEIGLVAVGTAGTYSSVTVDAYGRVTAGTSGGGGGGISDIGIISTANTIGITGSPLTTNGTFNIDLATVGTAGTYSAVIVDAHGRVTGHRALQYSDLPSEVQSTLFSFGFPGSPTSNINIVVPIVEPTTIPNGFTNTAGYAITASTGSVTFNLYYVTGGTQTQVGSIYFSSSSHAATTSYLLGGDLSLAAGDVLIMSTPSSTDATLNNVGITVYALKQ